MSSNKENDNSNIPGFLLALATAGSAVGAAFYLNKKSKQLDHMRRYTKFYDVKSIKQLSFFPNHLKGINSLPNSPSLVSDFCSLIKIFKIEQEDLLVKVLDAPNDEVALEAAISKIMIIKCLVTQNIKLLTDFRDLPITHLTSIDSTLPVKSDQERRTIVWIGLCYSALEQKDIVKLVEYIRTINGIYSEFKKNNLNSVNKQEKITQYEAMMQLVDERDKDGLSENSKQIVNDVKRTFFKSTTRLSTIEEDGNLHDKRLMLALILKNYCMNEEQYCQGMNNVVGFIISMFSCRKDLNLENVLLNSFITYFSLMKGYYIKQVYSDDLIGLHYGQLCIEKMLKDNAPIIYKDMIKTETIPLSWSVQWFLTLFTYTFKFEDVERLWDGIFLYGFLYILKIAGSIIKIVERVDVHDKDELNKVISEFPKNFNLDIELFIKMVNGYPITYREIKEFVSSIPTEDTTVVRMAMKDLGL